MFVPEGMTSSQDRGSIGLKSIAIVTIITKKPYKKAGTTSPIQDSPLNISKSKKCADGSMKIEATRNNTCVCSSNWSCIGLLQPHLWIVKAFMLAAIADPELGGKAPKNQFRAGL
jgi:hypothetical protein